MTGQVLSLEQYKCEAVTRTALEGVVLPPATDTYQPIPHTWLLDELSDKLADIGITFGRQHHGLSHDGARYFGVIHLEGFLGVEEGLQVPMMGVRNSLDKRFGAQVCFGNQIMVCANLCFWGTYMLGRKHTTHIMRDLPEIISRTLEGVPAMNDQQSLRFDAYRDSRLGQVAADHMVVEMLRHGAVNPARIGKVVDEWDKPTFDHGEDRSVWRMFNAATQALKGVNAHEMPQRTIALTQVCDEAVGFKAAA
jgi:hypothetical protein